VLNLRPELLRASPGETTSFPPPSLVPDAPFDAVLTAQELGVRYLTVNDRFRDDRAAWTNAIFPDAETYPFSFFGRAISPARATAFDVLIIGGNDMTKIASQLRAHDVLLHQVIKIALGCDLGPMQRAQALAAGFDDVFDAARMQPEEAVARLRGIHRRYALNAARLSRELNEASVRSQQLAKQAVVFGYVAFGMRLSRPEYQLLSLLASNRGETVRYLALRNAMGNHHETPSFEHLKVSICLLRKKLRPGIKIIATTNRGYRLDHPNPPLRSAD